MFVVCSCGATFGAKSVATSGGWVAGVWSDLACGLGRVFVTYFCHMGRMAVDSCV